MERPSEFTKNSGSTNISENSPMATMAAVRLPQENVPTLNRLRSNSASRPLRARCASQRMNSAMKITPMPMANGTGEIPQRSGQDQDPICSVACFSRQPKVVVSALFEK